MRPEDPLPWEQLLWSGRPAFAGPRHARYVLTDFRIVAAERNGVVEIALYDVRDVQRTESRVDRLFGTSTVIVHSRRATERMVLRRIRRGAQLAALLELMAGDTRASLDADAVNAALEWDPRGRGRYRRAIGGISVFLLAVLVGAAMGLPGRATALPNPYASDDPIYPGGRKRSRPEIVQFMQNDVLPWARDVIGPIVGGADRVTCETCHGRNPEMVDWQMPAVAALPLPDVRNRGWERWGGVMDAQIRNAVYGYVAEPEKQTRAGYMREGVMPGMARLLHRPAYDFTRPYDYNRSQLAFGCYHCHKVK